MADFFQIFRISHQSGKYLILQEKNYADSFGLLRETYSPGVFFLIVSAINISAATFTAAANGDWGSAATWTFTGTDADGIPDADDTVTIPNPRVVTVSSPHSVQNLTVAGGGTLTLNADLMMSGAPTSSFTSNGTTNGSGTLRTQGVTSLSIGGTAFTAPIIIASETTTINR